MAHKKPEAATIESIKQRTKTVKVAVYERQHKIWQNTTLWLWPKSCWIKFSENLNS